MISASWRAGSAAGVSVGGVASTDGQRSRRDVLHVDDAVAVVIAEGTERLSAGRDLDGVAGAR